MRALDASGICLSLACLVHCVAAPFVLMASPALAAAVGGETLHVHWTLLAVAAPIAAFGLWLGFQRTGPSATLIAGAILGVGLMTFGALELFEAHAVSDMLTVVGVSVLAGVHAWNWRRRAACVRSAAA